MPTRSLVPLILPEGVLLLLAAALVHWGGGLPGAAPAIRVFPLAVLAAGLVMGWRFQRGRLVLALGGLVVADVAMRWLAPLESDAAYAGPVIVRTTMILLVGSFAALSFATERGLLSNAGLRRQAVFAGLVLVLLATWIVAGIYPDAVAHAMNVTLVPAGWLGWMRVGQPAALAALVAILTLAGRAVWRPDPESRGFLWAAVAAVMAAAAGPAGGRATAYLACAGLVLVIAAVERAYAMAYHDELTGLPARRALNEALERAGGTYTVAMVDVDHFKKFNDTHGHDVGDQVLRMVAGRLARVQGGGRAYRYGGEEFAVLFPGKGTDESAPHLEALRASVAGAAFTKRGKDRPKQKPKTPRARGESAKALAVTVSIGAAQARGAVAPDAVVKAADKALYRAKEAGRNRVAL